MIHFEDKARETLLEQLQKPKNKLEPPAGKTTILRKFKNDKLGENIYVIDNDDNGIPDEEIRNCLERHERFKTDKHIFLFEDTKVKEKYIVVFYPDFPSWLIKALTEIDMKPSNYGFSDQKGAFHREIRDKDRKESFRKLLVDLNKNKSCMFKILKDIVSLVNNKH